MQLNEKVQKVSVIFRDHDRIEYESATIDYANRIIRTTLSEHKQVMIPFEAVYAVTWEVKQ